MGEFNAKDANFLWRQIGRIDGVIETLNRWNHPHFPTRKCPSEVARQGKYNV